MYSVYNLNFTSVSLQPESHSVLKSLQRGKLTLQCDACVHGTYAHIYTQVPKVMG
jgi:hypothetical protein